MAATQNSVAGKIKLVLFLELIVAAPLSAQSLSVVPPSGLKQSRMQYESALSAWNAANSNLERDLLKKDPQESLHRIEAAAESTERLAAARSRYYTAVITLIQDHINLLQKPIEVLDSAKGLEDWQNSTREKLDSLSIRQRQISTNGNGGASADPRSVLIQEQMNKQVKTLQSLEDNLKLQLSSTDRALKSAAQLNDGRSELLEGARQILGLMSQEKEKATEETRFWIEYYGSLKEFVAASSKQEKKRHLDTAKPSEQQGKKERRNQ
jgi:DNA-binding protein H-NS